MKTLYWFYFPLFGKATRFPHLGAPELSSWPRRCDPAHWFLVVVKVQRMGPIWVQEFQDLQTRSIKSCDHDIIQACNHQSSRTLTGIWNKSKGKMVTSQHEVRHFPAIWSIQHDEIMQVGAVWMRIEGRNNTLLWIMMSLFAIMC